VRVAETRTPRRNSCRSVLSPDLQLVIRKVPLMKSLTKKSETETASSTETDHKGTVQMKTHAHKSTTVSEATNDTAVPTGLVEPVPTAAAPPPPENYAVLPVERGNRPQRIQVSLALKVATELQSRSDYAELFGNAAPNPVSVADALTLAKGWSDKLQNATAWYQYVKQEEHAAWKQALTLTNLLRVPFEFRLARDASIGDLLPSLAAFLGAATARAVRGVITRKKNKAAKQATPASASSTSSSTTTSSADVLSDPLKAAAVRLLN
jgi:hypothetical protein